MKRYYVDTRYCEEVDDTQLSPTRYERIMVPTSDYDALLADAKRLYEALENAIELTDPSLTDSERDWTINQGLDTAGGFRERWLQEGL